jgi:hypothetical protein
LPAGFAGFFFGCDSSKSGVCPLPNSPSIETAMAFAPGTSGVRSGHV